MKKKMLKSEILTISIPLVVRGMLNPAGSAAALSSLNIEPQQGPTPDQRSDRTSSHITALGRKYRKCLFWLFFFREYKKSLCVFSTWCFSSFHDITNAVDYCFITIIFLIRQNILFDLYHFQSLFISFISFR